MNQNNNLVDFSYVMELGSGKPDFVKQVLAIFLDNTPPGLKELEQLIRGGDDWEKISKQAHFLKSSVGIVKVKDMYERLQQIEMLAKQKKQKDTIVSLLNDIVADFDKAEAIIKEKMEEA